MIINEFSFRLDVAKTITVAEDNFRKSLKVQCMVLAAWELSIWQQKSRLFWLSEGVCNNVISPKSFGLHKEKTIFLINISLSCQSQASKEKWKARGEHFTNFIVQCRDRSKTLNLQALDFAQCSSICMVSQQTYLIYNSGNDGPNASRMPYNLGTQ
jgi:hypothetical protein